MANPMSASFISCSSLERRPILDLQPKMWHVSSVQATYESTPSIRQPSLDPEMAPDKVPTPGSCVMRLQGIENMSQEGKVKLLRSISDDLCALLMCIGQHADAGNLDTKSTSPLDEVVKMIRDAEVGYRRSLERELRRLRKQKRWMRKEYRGVVRSAEVLAGAYRAKVQALKHAVRGLRVEGVGLKTELEILRFGKGKQVGIGEEEREDSSRRDCGKVERVVEMEGGEERQECDADADSKCDADGDVDGGGDVDADGEWENDSAERRE